MVVGALKPVPFVGISLVVVALLGQMARRCGASLLLGRDWCGVTAAVQRVTTTSSTGVRGVLTQTTWSGAGGAASGVRSPD